MMNAITSEPFIRIDEDNNMAIGLIRKSVPKQQKQQRQQRSRFSFVTIVTALLLVTVFLGIFNIGEFGNSTSRITAYLPATSTISIKAATDTAVDNDGPSLTLLNITPATYTHPCTAQSQSVLESLTGGGLHLQAAMPPVTSRSWKRGQVLRVPVYNLHPNVERDWHYDVWARLVGETTQTYTTFTQLHIYTAEESAATARRQKNNEVNSTALLFAEIDFHIWEPDTYQLQIEIRYLYGSSQPPPKYTGDWSQFTKRVFTPPLQDLVQTKGLFRYNPSVATVFPEFYTQYTPVIYMGDPDMGQVGRFFRYYRENPKEGTDNTSSITQPAAKSQHDFWVENHCFGIHGSPYTLQVVDTISQPQHLKQDDHADDPTTKQEPPEQKTRRRCGISDTHKPGYWRKIQVDCTSSSDRNNNSSLYHEGCGYFWDASKKGMGYIYETQGCQWKFLTATDLLPCMEAINRTMYFIGDSLIRYIIGEVQGYLTNHVKLPIPIDFHSDWKKLRDKVSIVDDHDGHGFPINQGGVFIDDFMLVHRIGFGPQGTISHLESSPGNVARNLYLHKQWFQNQTARFNEADAKKNSAARFIFYLPHYVNDRVKPQAFEPQMSYYSALMGSFLQSELGYEIFNTMQITRGIPEGMQDGIHLQPQFLRNMALILLNSICSTPEEAS
jgi:hypothetical protein